MHKMFVEHWMEHYPDVSDRPDIRPEQTQFWKMTDDGETAIVLTRRNTKKRHPASHSRLKGLQGKRLNASFDFTIDSNKWCVIFKDDEGVTVNLVDECIIMTWLHYISKMVRNIARKRYIVPITYTLTLPYT